MALTPFPVSAANLNNWLFSNVSSVMEIFTLSLYNGIIFSLRYLSWAPTCFPLGLDNKTIVRTRNPSRFNDSAMFALWHLQSLSAAEPNNPTQCQLVCLGCFTDNQLDKVHFLGCPLIRVYMISWTAGWWHISWNWSSLCKKSSMRLWEQNTVWLFNLTEDGDFSVQNEHMANNDVGRSLP